MGAGVVQGIDGRFDSQQERAFSPCIDFSDLLQIKARIYFTLGTLVLTNQSGICTPPIPLSFKASRIKLGILFF